MKDACAEQIEQSDDWLTALAVPCADDPGGVDLRYSDAFGQVKQEMDKLKGNDFVLIRSCCREMLAASSKDLRLAGYHLLAAAFLEGAAGVLEGARAYRLLLERFWEHCHPRRGSGRIAALRWLNNPRLEAYLQRHVEAVPRELVTELQDECTAINDLIRSRAGEDVPFWTVLDGWLQPNHVSEITPAGPEKEAQSEATARAPSEATGRTTEPPAPGATINSERDLHTATRRIGEYLVGRGELLQAVAFARALRWGSLRLPPAEQGRTRIPGPRSAAENELARVRTAGDPDAVVHCCEAIFLEPGGHLWLDLQFAAHEAAGRSGHTALANFIADQAASLVKRLPGRQNLSFEDGRLFAGPQTSAWLTGLDRQAFCALRTQEDQSDWPATLDATRESACALAGENRLDEGLRLLAKLPFGNARERLRVQLAQGALCLEAGRADIACPLLTELEEYTRRNGLALWDEGLALELWRLTLEALRSCARQAEGEERQALEQKARRLHALICRTDPAQAAGWFKG